MCRYTSDVESRDEVETVVHSDNDFATVAYLRVKKASLIAKGHSANAQLIVPPILSQPFVALRDTISDSSGQQQPDGDPEAARSSSIPIIARAVTSKRIGNWVSVANVQRRVEGACGLPGGHLQRPGASRGSQQGTSFGLSSCPYDCSPSS